MSRRKGEFTSGKIDRRYPHQVAIRADRCAGKNHEAVHGFCANMRLAPRCHVRRNDVDYVVFLLLRSLRRRYVPGTFFSGEQFDPKERGRGAAWHD